MRNRCCVDVCFLNNSSNAHTDELLAEMILRNFISLRAFTVHMENSPRFENHFGQIDRSEICSEVNFTSPKLMLMQIIKLPYTEMKFYHEVKSETGLILVRVSCKRTLSSLNIKNKYLRRSLSGNMGLENNDNLSAK